MNINVITKTFNNAWLVPYFFRHYDQYDCNYFIWDNMSTDGTRELLASHPKVKVFDNYSQEFDDYEHRDFKNTAWKEFKNCDFIFNIDFDELLYYDNLSEVLNNCKLYKNDSILKTIGFQMFSDNLPTSKGQIYEEINTGLREELYDKPIILNPNIEIDYSFGAHYATSKHPIYESPIYLLHYKFIGTQSIDELLNRNKRLSQRNIDNGLSIWLDQKGNRFNPFEVYHNLKINSKKVV